MLTNGTDSSQAAELAALCRLLVVGQGGFSLSVAVCNSPTLRDRLIEKVRQECPSFVVVTIPPHTNDVYEFVRRTETSSDTALFLVGLESSISDAESDDTTLRSLNASRDLWPTAFACPVIFWLPEYAARALSETARDFWRIRSHRFYFVAQDHSPKIRHPDTYDGRYLTATSLSADEKQMRIAELEQRLAQADSLSPNMQSHILNWWDELATLHRFVGNLDEALRIRREVQLPVYERLGDVYMKAITMVKIADVLQIRGQLSETLRIRREEQLPVFQQMGDVYMMAVTMGQIADVLQDRGDWAEALRIRREEELPVYERLGEVRSKALTMGRIADVLQDRGEWDEALRIRREEELPVYEQLGDVRERAVTMGRIADLMADVGEYDAAIDSYRDEIIPTMERLQDISALVFLRRNFGQLLLNRNADCDREEAQRLLKLALSDARRLGLPEADEIRQCLEQLN